ncbi:MAG: hypothetical protein SPI06_04305 [Terrisporobacter sp.]|uniref:hypothetical protein n=1 Tax=Terrisporobacter sp. TaxID=1965305 RepID=UPI002A911E2F|nr:hypothetical protein [Terrisporobacter sp.]MDY6152613.1 hypothetical protein [Terrisporobacter sp.]
MDDVECEAKQIVDNFEYLRYENSILKALLKYKKPSTICSKKVAEMFISVANKLKLSAETIYLEKDKYKIIIWKKEI